MQKLSLQFISIAALFTLFAPLAFSQSFFFGGGSKTTSNPIQASSSPGAVQPNPVIAPSDFGSLVNTLDKQTKSNLASQYNQQLNRSAPQQPNANSANVNPDASTSIQNTAPPPPLPQIAEPPPEASTPPDVESRSATSGKQAAPLPPPPIPTINQPQVYTGFGAGNQNAAPGAQPTAPAGNPGGGWNIKY
jgi:hypothetical protein